MRKGHQLPEYEYISPNFLYLSYLGSTPIWNWLTANTALANTGGMRQPAHKDSGCFAHPQYPYYFIANVPLCNFSVESGSTEFWLGSNLETSSDDQLKAKSAEDTKLYPMARMGDSIPPIADWAKEERAKVRPPIQPQCGPGDIMIRDLRTWHAGMPNFSDSHRVMLGLGYQVSSNPLLYSFLFFLFLLFNIFLSKKIIFGKFS